MPDTSTVPASLSQKRTVKSQTGLAKTLFNGGSKHLEG